MNTNITKQEALEILMTISALESWSFSTKTMLPDYLFENITRDIEVLRRIVLGEEE